METAPVLITPSEDMILHSDVIEAPSDAQGENQLSEDEVDLLMDALDDEEDTSMPENEEPKDDLQDFDAQPIELRYSFSLPTVGVEAVVVEGDGESVEDTERADQDKGQDDDQESTGDDGPSSEDSATEPASCSDDVSPSANLALEKEKMKLKAKRTLDERETASSQVPASQSNKAAKLSESQDDWTEARAISHLMLSPYDASLGLLSRVDTR